MRVLGVNGSGATLWIALVGEAGPEPCDPASLILKEGDEGGYALHAFQTEAEHALARLSPEQIVILDPEPTGTLRWKATLPRVSAETMFTLAAVELGITVHRMARATVRGRLSLGKSGSLASHAKNAYPDKVGFHWVGQRDVAALAAAATQAGT